MTSLGHLLCSTWITTLAMAKDLERFGRLRHIQLQLYWLRDVIEEGQIAPEYVQTDLMVADPPYQGTTCCKGSHTSLIYGSKVIWLGFGGSFVDAEMYCIGEECYFMVCM